MCIAECGWMTSASGQLGKQSMSHVHSLPILFLLLPCSFKCFIFDISSYEEFLECLSSGAICSPRLSHLRH